eukprot:366205-Chlamydomonas_euryale.AAC.4
MRARRDGVGGVSSAERCGRAGAGWVAFPARKGVGTQGRDVWRVWCGTGSREMGQQRPGGQSTWPKLGIEGGGVE